MDMNSDIFFPQRLKPILGLSNFSASSYKRI